MNVWVEIIGGLGAFSVVGAYGLLSAKKLRSDSYGYHGLNILGSFLLALYAYWKTAVASVAVNVIWLCIGVGAVVALKRSLARKE
jgi:fluoride ion exporter CrcB/FEX